jgi:hypothetical protein
VFGSSLRKLFPFLGVSSFVEDLTIRAFYGPYFSNCTISRFSSWPDGVTVVRQLFIVLQKSTVQLMYSIRMCFASGCSTFIMEWIGVEMEGLKVFSMGSGHY